MILFAYKFIYTVSSLNINFFIDLSPYSICCNCYS
jgi:hypothetical protein